MFNAVKGISCDDMKPLWLQTPVQLSNHLRSFRRARGLTQAALGELIGLDQTRIAKIERDPRLVSVGQLLKLLAVLHVRVADRLDERLAGRGVGNTPGWPQSLLSL